MAESIDPSPASADSGADSEGQPFGSLNGTFHRAYGGATGVDARQAIVFVALADSLVVARDGDRHELSFTPPAFHVIKAVAHAPLALYVAVERFAGHALSSELAETLGRARIAIEAARATLSAEPMDPRIRGDLEPLLERSIELANKVLGQQVVEAEALATFAREMRSPLLRATEHAAHLQLEALDAVAKRAVAALGPADRARLHVVVTGNHQARERSLAMQYFRARLGSLPDEADRVVYGEGIQDAEAAIALVAKRRLDRKVAKAFFGDPARLERDVLGDATAAAIATMRLGPFA